MHICEHYKLFSANSFSKLVVMAGMLITMCFTCEKVTGTKRIIRIAWPPAPCARLVSQQVCVINLRTLNAMTGDTFWMISLAGGGVVSIGSQASLCLRP